VKSEARRMINGRHYGAHYTLKRTEGPWPTNVTHLFRPKYIYYLPFGPIIHPTHGQPLVLPTLDTIGGTFASCFFCPQFPLSDPFLPIRPFQASYGTGFGTSYLQTTSCHLLLCLLGHVGEQHFVSQARNGWGKHR